MRASNIAITHQERETGGTESSPMKLSHQCSVEVQKANWKKNTEKIENIIKSLLKFRYIQMGLVPPSQKHGAELD